LAISDTLAAFRFSSDPSDMPDFSSLIGNNNFNDDDDVHPLGESSTQHMETGETHDFFGDDDFEMGGGDAGGGFDDNASMAGDEGETAMDYNGGVGMAAAGEAGPFDPRRQAGQGELVMALHGGEDDEGMFDYFDKGFGKAWAGVEHWKLRKVSRKGESWWHLSYIQARQVC
jgi:condensin complex subunit 2